MYIFALNLILSNLEEEKIRNAPHNLWCKHSIRYFTEEQHFIKKIFSYNCHHHEQFSSGLVALGMILCCALALTSGLANRYYRSSLRNHAT